MIAHLPSLFNIHAREPLSVVVCHPHVTVQTIPNPVVRSWHLSLFVSPLLPWFSSFLIIPALGSSFLAAPLHLSESYYWTEALSHPSLLIHISHSAART